jgi:hypothetical protein
MIKNKISPFYNTSLDQELDWIKHVCKKFYTRRLR